MPRTRPGRPWRLLVACCVVVLGLAGCGNGDAGSATSDDSPSGKASGQVTVFAAASLTEAFTEIGKDFEAANPDANVQFNFAGSSTLAQQIDDGAPADVFASANQDQMQVVADADLVDGDPAVFVQNKLQIAVPPGNPAHVGGLSAFGKPDLKIAICAKEVPCGAAAQEVFEIAGIDPAADTLEKDVKAVLTKVGLGEADAGLVYVTDVASSGGDVDGVDFPEADQAVNDYPIAVLNTAPNGEAANAFADYVSSTKGQRVLKKYGFVTGVS